MFFFVIVLLVKEKFVLRSLFGKKREPGATGRATG